MVMKRMLDNSLSLLVTLIVVAGQGSNIVEGYPEAEPKARLCFQREGPMKEPVSGVQCNRERRCYIAKYNKQEDYRNHRFQAGCLHVDYRHMLEKAGLMEKPDGCYPVSAPEGQALISLISREKIEKRGGMPFSYICTCNEDNCNSEVLNYTSRI